MIILNNYKRNQEDIEMENEALESSNAKDKHLIKKIKYKDLFIKLAYINKKIIFYNIGL